MVTRNKSGSQKWLPGTNLGAKNGYPEQTWEPKLVTRNKPGSQNWLPERCQESLLKVSGGCMDGVLTSGQCLDGV